MSETPATATGQRAQGTPRYPDIEDGDTVIVPPWSCPEWCAGPPKHYFEADGVSNHSSRTHEIDFGTVSICQRETVIDAGAGGVVRERPYLFVWGVKGDLSASQGRQLGEALIAAANRLDRIAAEAGR